MLKNSKSILLSIFTAITFSFLGVNSASAADKTWSGAGDGVSWSNGANWSDEILPANGDNVLFQSGQSSFNDLSGLNLSGLGFYGSGASDTELVGNSFRVGAILDSNTGDSLTLVGNNIGATSTLQIQANNLGYIGFGGDMYLSANNLGLRAHDDGLVLIAGKVNSTGKVVVGGNGLGVAIDGSVIRPITVKEQGLLLGSGYTGSITVVTDSWVLPTGCLKARNLTIDGTYAANLSGTTPCSGNKRINAVGKVDIGGATLARRDSLAEGYSPGTGSKFILISNDSTDRVVGTFKGLAEGASFAVGSHVFKITYKGGSGNDVVITKTRNATSTSSTLRSTTVPVDETNSRVEKAIKKYESASRTF